VKADVNMLATALASSTNATVKADLTALQAGLATVVADITNGTNATQDLARLTNQLTTLNQDLGSTATSSVRHELRDLRQDFRNLSRDLRFGDLTRGIPPVLGGVEGIGFRAVTDIQRTLASVKADVRALAAALASNTSAAVKADLTALQADLASVSADIAAGTSAAQDLSKLTADVTTLTTDLGTGITSNVRRVLTSLRNDLRGMTNDLTTLANSVNQSVADLQSDLSQLSQQLGPNASATVTADLNALDAAMATLAADASAGKNLSADISAVFSDQLTLMGDLNGQAGTSVRVTLIDMAFDLTGLGVLTI